MSSTESHEYAPLVRWPSAEWRAAFHKQVTNTMLDAAKGTAAIAIARNRHNGVPTDLSAMDVAQDVLTATWEGTLTWRPERVPLLTHVRDAIKNRCRHAYRRHRDTDPAPEIALDALDQDEAIWTDVEDALASAVTEIDADLADLARRLVVEIVGHRNGDSAVIAVLAAMAQGETTDAELADATGLDAHAIHNAKRRIQRSARQASPDLIADIGASLGIPPERLARLRDDRAAATATPPSAPARRVERVRRVEAARRSVSDVVTAVGAFEQRASEPKRAASR